MAQCLPHLCVSSSLPFHPVLIRVCCTPSVHLLVQNSYDTYLPLFCICICMCNSKTWKQQNDQFIGGGESLFWGGPIKETTVSIPNTWSTYVSYGAPNHYSTITYLYCLDRQWRREHDVAVSWSGEIAHSGWEKDFAWCIRKIQKKLNLT
jgi:hypothetical protein